jgi:hypothetical protein
LHLPIEPDIEPILSLFDQARQLESQRPQVAAFYQQAVNPLIQTDHRKPE